MKEHVFNNCIKDAEKRIKEELVNDEITEGQIMIGTSFENAKSAYSLADFFPNAEPVWNGKYYADHIFIKSDISDNSIYIDVADIKFVSIARTKKGV